MNKIKPKLIFYELNEVPRKVLEKYIKLYPNSAFAEIVQKGILLDTFTRDEGELHPWSTWPTVHRGVPNTTHKIYYINQDLSEAAKYKPIWEILSENSIDVGIFGALQSYPPIKGKHVKFHLPDTFAPASDSYPEKLSEFQSFNLDLSGSNKAKVREVSKKNIINAINLVLQGDVSVIAAFKSVFHLFKEKINPKYKARRSTLQAVLSFDLFRKYLEKYNPIFSNYFTNHVAGIMHRFWIDLFPPDSIAKLEVDDFHSKSILKAMRIADNHIRYLLKINKTKNYNIIVLSSMGQESIKQEEYSPEITLNNLSKLINTIELDPKDFKLMPAMQPQVTIECNNKKSLDLLRERVKNIKDVDGNQLLVEGYPPLALRLTLSMKASKCLSISNKIFYLNRELDLESVGFELFSRDQGSAYHIPEGILIAKGAEIEQCLVGYSPSPLDTCKIAPLILNLYGIEAPSYMKL